MEGRLSDTKEDTYEVIYTATDDLGATATAKREIAVTIDAMDAIMKTVSGGVLTQPDNTVSPFDPVDQTGVAVSTATISAAFVVDLADDFATNDISVDSGSYSINEGVFTSAAGTVTGGDSIRGQINSSSSNSTAVSQVMTIGAETGSFTVTTAAVSTGDPYDLSPFTIGHTVTWPTAPTTTSTFNVPADGSFATGVSTSGRRVIVAAGYTGAGLTSGFADDIEIIMDDTATITSPVNIRAASRVSWTGGNSDSIYSGDANDILLNNVKVDSTTESQGIAFGGPLAGGTGDFHRVAVINCSASVVGNGAGQGWGLALWGFGTTPMATDVIVANGNFSSDEYQASRINGVTRLVVVDTICRAETVGYSGGAYSNSAWRYHHSCQDVHSENNIGVGHAQVETSGGDSASGIYNGEVINDHRFVLTSSSGQFFYINGSPSPTGSITDCTVHYQGGAGSFGSYGAFTDGGGNTRIAWDGSTLDFTGLGLKFNSVSGYGADH